MKITKGQRNAIIIGGVAVVAFFVFGGGTLFSALFPSPPSTVEGKITVRVGWLNGTDISSETDVTIYTVAASNASLDYINLTAYDELGTFTADEIEIDADNETIYIAYLEVDDGYGNRIEQWEFLDENYNAIRLIPTAEVDETYVYHAVVMLDGDKVIGDVDFGLVINRSVYGEKGLGVRGYPFNGTAPEDAYENVDALTWEFEFDSQVASYNETTERYESEIFESENVTFECQMPFVAYAVGNTTVKVVILADIVDSVELKYVVDKDFYEDGGSVPTVIDFAATYAGTEYFDFV